MADQLILLHVGMGVGILSTLFGIGGSVIAIPAIYLLYPSIPPLVVTGCSLCMIAVNCLLNFVRFKKFREWASKRLVITLCLTMGLGVIIGIDLSTKLPAETIKLIFAAIAFSMAIRLGFFKREPKPGKREISSVVAAIIGINSGLISGITGVGGGSVLVPLLVALSSVATKKIPAYSNMAMLISSSLGVIRLINTPLAQASSLPPWADLYQLGNVNLVICLYLIVGSAIASKLGVTLGQKLPMEVLNKLFAGLLFLISTKISYQVFFLD